MNLSNKPIIIIIIVAAVIVLLITKFGKKKEGFAPMEPDLFQTPNYKNLSPAIWASQWYQAQQDPATNIPLQKLYQEYEKLPTKMGAHKIRMMEEHMEEQEQEQQQRMIPVPRNVPTGQAEQVAAVPGTESINQVGAPLTEVIKQEVALVGPMQFMSPELQEIMRQEQMKLNELSAQYQQPQNMVEMQPDFNHNDMTPEVRQAEMEQRMRTMNKAEARKLLGIAEQIGAEVAPETQFRHSEMIPEYNQEFDVESLIQDLATGEQEMEYKQELLAQELMPGMEQKSRLEQELSEQLGEQVVVQVQVENNNLALAILLSVLLVGFVYQTSE